ncbi:MAG: glutamine-hydrolyzing carbamoyl-phosphate synthase small subunit [Pseudomonadota bacterium]|nr:glutamine-hydrolyzing carbamoyl-phosphate synthase small subunit [Pseudomonadota bacterium]MEC8145644.1 glutamine-hydrolyzing carbamoyl-phosphate synthase small subunit [Pseudomonadota bacterium]
MAPNTNSGRAQAAPREASSRPTAVLVLSDGSVFEGRGFGAAVTNVGEVCFNTSMTGYQEIMTDPSYAGQIITFTFPHIGNVGANAKDHETGAPSALGMIIRQLPTAPANWRSESSLEAWMVAHDLPGIAGVDTRALTRRIRDAGAPAGVICHNPDGVFDIDALAARARDWPGLAGMDLAIEVTRDGQAAWDEGSWDFLSATHLDTDAAHRVVAMDFGCKDNILRCLTDAGCDVTVVPAETSAETILAMNPDGVFLSNGPGDPAATGDYAAGEISAIIDSGLPVFGICIGHQLMALAMGASTTKMERGHRGANHPVKDLATGRIEITSQNHGFVVDPDSLPETLEVTHMSLFDGSVEGLRHREKPAFCVQYHPESSPGPHDSRYLFDRFTALMDERKG